MLNKLLLRLGLALVDLDLVARVLAADLMRGQDLDVLEANGTKRELRRKYAAVALETGLPLAAQEKVGEMAWQYMAAARDEQKPQAVNRKEFSFYP